MARFTNNSGKIVIQTLQDLKRGDKVCITFYGGKYVKTTVIRVRTVECATIITIKKISDCRYTHFVGYKGSSIATAGNNTILTLDTYWADSIEENLSRAEERSKVIITRAKALRAMMDLKNWLFTNENNFLDNEPE